jgi:hypothetical protein
MLVERVVPHPVITQKRGQLVYSPSHARSVTDP